MKSHMAEDGQLEKSDMKENKIDKCGVEKGQLKSSEVGESKDGKEWYRRKWDWEE